MQSDALRKLGQQSLIYGVGGLINRFIGFLLLPVFTHYLSPADYGVMAILNLVAFVFTSVLTLGVGASMGPCYLERDDPEVRDRTFWASMVYLLPGVLVLLGIAKWGGPIVSQWAFASTEYHELVSLVSLSVALSVLATPLTLALQFDQRARAFVVLAVATTLASMSITIFMVVWLERGLRGMVEAGVAGSLLTLLAYGAVSLRGRQLTFHAGTLRELARLGLPLVPSFAFLFVMQDGNKYLLQWFSGLDELGIYSLGFSLGLVMNLFVSAFQRAWLPFFMEYRERWDEAEDLFGQVLTYMVLGLGALNLLAFAWARPVVLVMADAKFSESWQIVGFSAAAQVLAGVFYVMLPGMYFSKEVRYVSVIQAFSASVSVVVNLVGIRMFGVIGAAFGLVAGFAVMAISTHLWNRARKERYPQIHYEWSRLRTFGLLYLGIASASWLPTGAGVAGAILLAIALTAATLGGVVALLQQEERDWLRSLPSGVRGAAK